MEKELRVVPVAPAAAANLWPHIEGYIARALKRGNLERAHFPYDILVHVLSDRMGLWIATDGEKIDAAIITRIMQFDRCRTCHVYLVGGRNMRAWLPLAMTEIESYARKAGCIAMEGGARFGWVRAAGYRENGVALVKEL